MKAFLFNTILPPILWLVLHLWGMTLRTKTLNPEIYNEIRNQLGKGILTLWHSHLFYLTYHFRGMRDLYILVSPSKDGDLIANVARMFGYKVVRGSSFKKTVPGTRECLSLLKQDLKIGLIADGSRGPYHQAQAGSVQLSRITGAPIYTLSWDASLKYEFSSWDKFILPLPLSKVTLNFGSPMIVSPDADKETIRQKQDELTDLLNQITEVCERS